jgi:Glyoxalase-like domain
MATRFQVTIDCAQPELLTRFWAVALGYRVEDPPAGATRVRVLEEAIDHFGVTMQDPEGNEFCVH